MTLEALVSNDLPNFSIYNTISATPTPYYPLQSFDFANTGDDGGDGGGDDAKGMAPLKPSSGFTRKKRRRKPRKCKNKEEAECQRMTHIAVERNRRRQMNEHLAALRSLMPESYVQRGDQASIVGGAINYVKELEQLLQSLEAQKITLQKEIQTKEEVMTNNNIHNALPFTQFFACPQYKWCSHFLPREKSPENHRIATAVADIEVTLIETHASVKILSPRRPGQLMRMVAGFQALLLCILHVNVTALDHMVLYSFSVKVEEGCNLSTVDDIAAAVHHMLSLIEAEATAFS